MEVEELLPAKANMCDIPYFYGFMDENNPKNSDFFVFCLILIHKTSKTTALTVYKVVKNISLNI